MAAIELAAAVSASTSDDSNKSEENKADPEKGSAEQPPQDEKIHVPEQPRSLILSCIFFGIVLAIVTLVWEVWDTEARQTLNDVAVGLAEQIRQRCDIAVHGFCDNPVIGAKLMEAMWTQNELYAQPILDGTPELDRALNSQIELFDFTNIYVGLEDNAFVIAGYALGKFDNRWQRIVGYRRYGNDTSYVKYAIDSLGFRNKSYVVFPSPVYNNINSGWYRSCKASQTTGWTDLYGFATGDVGITYYRPLFQYTAGSDPALAPFIGVIGVDITLQQIGPALSVLNLTTNGVAFIISQRFAFGEDRFVLIASSNWNEESINTKNIFKQYNGTTAAAIPYVGNASNPYIRRVGSYLKSKGFTYGGSDTLCVSDDGKSGCDFLLSYAPLRRPIPGLNWTVVVVIPIEDYLGSVHTANSITVALAIASGVSTVVLVCCFVAIAPIVAEARTYRWKAFERARNRGDINLDNAAEYVPPQESDQRLEWLRVLSFEDKKKKVEFNWVNVRSGAYILYKFNLVTGEGLFGMLTLVCAVIVVALIGVWLVWKILTVDEVVLINNLLLKQTGSFAYDSTLNLMSTPQRINRFVAQKFQRGTLDFTNWNYDRFLVDVMNAFTVVGSSGDYIASKFFWGTPAGLYQSVETYSAGNTTQLRLTVRDPSTAGPALCTFPADDSKFPPCTKSFDLTIDKVRNISATNSRVYDVNCSYDPTMTGWYQSALANRFPQWSIPFISDDTGELVVAATWPLFYANGQPAAVLGTYFRLAVLSDSLKELVAAAPGTKNNVIVVTNDANFVVVGSSNAEGVLQQVDNTTVRLLGSASSVQDIAGVAAYLTQSGTDVIDEQGSTSLKRLITDPVTAAGFIRDPYGLDYIAITLLDQNYWLDGLYSYQTFSLLLTTFAMVIMLLVIGYAFTHLRAQVSLGEIPHEALEDLGAEEISREALEKCRDEIRPLVKKAGAIMAKLEGKPEKEEKEVQKGEQKDEQKDEQKGDEKEKEKQDEIQRKLLEVGAFFITSTQKDRNVLLVCELLKQGNYKWYKFVTSKNLRTLLTVITLIHAVVLSFIRPLRIDPSSIPGAVLAPDWIFLTVELLFISALLLINYRFIPQATYTTDSLIGTILRQDIHFITDFGAALTWVLAFSDWIYQAVSGQSFEYYFPIRIWFLVFLNHRVYFALRTFAFTLIRAATVFLLFFVLLVSFTTISFSMFRTTINPGVFADGFADYLDSLVTICIFILNGDNYSNLVYPTLQTNKYLIVFWLILTISCLWFLIALVLAIFQREFSKEREAVNSKFRFRARMGLVSAFILVDEDGSGSLDQKEFLKFVAVLDDNQSKPGLMLRIFGALFHKCYKSEQTEIIRGVRGEDMDAQIERIQKSDFFQRINSDGSDDVDVLEFVSGIENSFALLRRQHEPKTLWGLNLEEFVLDTRYQTLRLALCLVNVFIVSLYGLEIYGVSDFNVDKACFAFLLLFLLDVLVMMWVFGPSQYFFYHKFNPDVDFVSFANQFEFVVLLLSWFTFIGFSIAQTSLQGGPGCAPPRCPFTSSPEYAHFRLAFALPSLRLMVLVKSTRQLVMTLLTVLTRFVPLVILLVFFVHIYAVYGVLVYGEGWSLLNPADAPNGEFTNLQFGYLALFEMMVGSSWSDTMYKTMMQYGRYALWFYFSFVMLVGILFTQLFIGNLLDAFGVFLDAEEQAQDVAKQMLKDGKSQHLIDTDLALARDAVIRSIG